MPLLFLLYSMCFGLTFMFWHPHLLVSFICGCQFYILQTGNRPLSPSLHIAGTKLLFLRIDRYQFRIHPLNLNIFPLPDLLKYQVNLFFCTLNFHCNRSVILIANPSCTSCHLCSPAGTVPESDALYASVKCKMLSYHFFPVSAVNSFFIRAILLSYAASRSRR